MPMDCCFKVCETKTLLPTDGRVEVKTVLPKSGLKKLRSARLWIAWKPNGEAVFHPHCWAKCVEATQTRGRNSRSKPQTSLLQSEVSFIREAEKTAEYFDSWSHVQTEAFRVAQMMLGCKCCVVFTGAGISTSAGIGDYRGKSGKWTQMEQETVNMDARVERDLKSQEESSPSPSKRAKVDEETAVLVEEEESSSEEDEDGVPYENLRPTYTHEALCKLVELGFVKYIISQNGDGLHGLSGVPQEKISELHGNVFMEKCEKCGARYDRDFYVMDDSVSAYYEELEDYGKTDIVKPPHAAKCVLCGLSHRTGRKCEKQGCSGHLADTIINFRDHLEEEVLDRAKAFARQSDLMLCLGSTLTVTPANSLVRMTQNPKRIVIVNRQETDFDGLCKKRRKGGGQLGARVFGDCDAFMKELMKSMLGQEELEAWERGRLERMKEYDNRRLNPVAT